MPTEPCQPLFKNLANLLSGETYLDIDYTEVGGPTVMGILVTDRMTDKLTAVTLCASAEG